MLLKKDMIVFMNIDYYNNDVIFYVLEHVSSCITVSDLNKKKVLTQKRKIPVIETLPESKELISFHFAEIVFIPTHSSDR